MTGFHVIPSYPREFQVPSGPPTDWGLAAFYGLIVWGFLVEPDPHQHEQSPPWLVIDTQPGPLGAERFAVPRLVPQCEWADEAAGEPWHESAWNGEAVPLTGTQTIVEVLDVEPIARGRRPNPPYVLQRRIAITLERDLQGRSMPDIARDHKLNPDDKVGADRLARRFGQKGRKLLSEHGGLPWAAFADGRLPRHWWQTAQFADALDRWHMHGSQLF